MNFGKLLSTLAVLGVTLACTTSVSAEPAQRLNACDFRSTMRKLWEDHITWTRLYLISAAANWPDKTAAQDRLLKNQTDIGDAVKPFYGDAAGQKLTQLLRSHIMIGGELIDAVRTGNGPAAADAQKRWYANADDIAAFLATANPTNWPADQMRQMLYQHLAATTTEVQARIRQDSRHDVAAYDRVHEQILQMADGLSTGIVNQFPQVFSATATRTVPARTNRPGAPAGR